jgi:hypothetical protein
MSKLKEMFIQDPFIFLMGIGMFLVCISMSFYLIALTFKLYL